MIRCAKDVIDEAKGRGFKIVVNPGPPPMPALRGQKEQATPALVEALKLFRLEIIDFVLAEQKAAEQKAAEEPEPDPTFALTTIEVPLSAKIYAQLENGSPCSPNDPKVFLWTFEGGPEWYYARTHTVPGVKSCEAKSAGSPSA